MDRCVYEFDPAEVEGSTWGIDEPWSCPHEAHPEADRCPFHLPADRRSELGVDAATVRDRLLSVVDADDADHKRLVGADLPTLALDYRTVDGRTRQPLDLRHADVDGLAFDHATVDQPIDLRGARIGRLSLDNAELETAVRADGATITGEVDTFESVFRGDVDFPRAEFRDRASFAESRFREEVTFDRARFRDRAVFEGARFHGRSNRRDDNASFVETRFATVSFDQADFEFAAFEGATFGERAGFQECTFDGEVVFDDAVFEGVADFDEARFLEDSLFRRTEYRGEAHFRGVEFEGGANLLDDDADFEEAVFHEDALFDRAEFVHADFRDAAFEGRADFEESTFEDDADFSGVRVEGPGAFQEAEFVDAVDFTDAAFEAGAEFENAEFSGDSNDRDDNADLSGATFGGEADFEQSTFVCARLAGTQFEGRAGFEDCVFDREVVFDDAVFEEVADFDEARFREDALFQRTEYHGEAHFRGVEFEGGANLLDDDADFEAARFHGPTTFEQGEFAYADFHEVTFEDDVVFERAVFEEDADFHDTTFGGLADFDEARFYGDGDFSNTVYRGRADFRGVEFIGEERHLQDSARFRGSTFEGAAEFAGAVLTTADFREVRLADRADFQDVEFRDRLAFAVGSVATTGSGRTAYVDMTGAHLADGTITQPDDHWVRYDMTRATIGPVELAGEGAAEADEQLFDYFRFVETDFDGFDFSAHRTYLERDDWQLHAFEETDDRDEEFAVAATPEAIETTYLYAYNNARAMGDGDAAIEFAIYQARFRRRKNVGYVRDPTLPTRYRARKVGDVVGNFLWYQSCGYGYRLWRIIAVSVGVIVLWAVLYAMPFTRLDNQESLSSAGALFSPEGVETAGTYLYYSLVTFTTVGYGDINPVNASARFLAVTEGVLGVLLAALVVFVLGRRVAL